MRTRIELATARGRSDTLLVLLPPALASIDDFYTQGFVEAVRQRQLSMDLLLADISGQQVLDRTVVVDLHEHVVKPAWSNGYRTIWLTGISLGAFSALHYAARHADLLAGLYLLSPYPGTGDVLNEICAAGGVARWNVQRTTHVDDPTNERAWWHWLAEQADLGAWTTKVHFGSGSDDRFLRGQTLISDLLPQDCIHRIPGAHQWTTWKHLWEDWLDHGPMQSPPR